MTVLSHSVQSDRFLTPQISLISVQTGIVSSQASVSYSTGLGHHKALHRAALPKTAVLYGFVITSHVCER